MFELAKTERRDHMAAWLINGEERISVGPAIVRGGYFRLELPPYRSRIIAQLRGNMVEMVGRWERHKGSDWVKETHFHAKQSGQPRFAAPERGPTAATIAALQGRWRVRFEQSSDDAVGLFEVDTNGIAKGTFLTTVGDYRFLAGRVLGRTLHLSCFDGAHAFLFRADLGEDGTLRGDFWSRASWHETWTAKKDPDVELPDAFGLTRWTGSAAALGELSYPDVDGKMRRLDDPEFGGRARLLVVFGTWCPNCTDLTRALLDLHARYSDRGLSILGLAFEFGDEPAARAEAVRTYRAHHGMRWPVLIAGPNDKAKASAAFPLLDRVRSYPTTIFMGASGEVEAVYTGFSGPATGELHRRLLARYEQLITRLLDGK